MDAQVPIRGLESHRNYPGLSPTGCKDPGKCFKQEEDMDKYALQHRNYGGKGETELVAGAEWDGQLVSK